MWHGLYSHLAHLWATLSPALNHWGPPGGMGCVAHLWATFDFVPCSEALGTP